MYVCRRCCTALITIYCYTVTINYSSRSGQHGSITTFDAGARVHEVAAKAAMDPLVVEEVRSAVAGDELPHDAVGEDVRGGDVGRVPRAGAGPARP